MTAGVVGSKKPLYDVWGDAVNMASRMDSKGEAGKIQVTENTAKVLQQEGYKCRFRGEIDVKIQRNVPTYFVELDDKFNVIRLWMQYLRRTIKMNIYFLFNVLICIKLQFERSCNIFIMWYWWLKRQAVSWLFIFALKYNFDIRHNFQFCACSKKVVCLTKNNKQYYRIYKITH